MIPLHTDNEEYDMESDLWGIYSGIRRDGRQQYSTTPRKNGLPERSNQELSENMKVLNLAPPPQGVIKIIVYDIVTSTFVNSIRAILSNGISQTFRQLK